jgi:hypothetical protein
MYPFFWDMTTTSLGDYCPTFPDGVVISSARFGNFNEEWRHCRVSSETIVTTRTWLRIFKDIAHMVDIPTKKECKVIKNRGRYLCLTAPRVYVPFDMFVFFTTHWMQCFESEGKHYDECKVRLIASWCSMFCFCVETRGWLLLASIPPQFGNHTLILYEVNEHKALSYLTYLSSNTKKVDVF